MRDFSSCTFCVHVVEVPLRIYRVLRYFGDVNFSYEKSLKGFLLETSLAYVLFCTPRKRGFFVLSSLINFFLVAVCLCTLRKRGLKRIKLFNQLFSCFFYSVIARCGASSSDVPLKISIDGDYIAEGLISRDLRAYAQR